MWAPLETHENAVFRPDGISGRHTGHTDVYNIMILRKATRSFRGVSLRRLFTVIGFLWLG